MNKLKMMGRPLAVTALAMFAAIGGVQLQPHGILLGAPPAKAQINDHCYRTFWPTSVPGIKIHACEYGGNDKSGYTVETNDTNRAYDVCYTLHFGNGKTFKGCDINSKPGEEWQSGCYYCNRQSGNGGLVDVDWRKVEPSR